MPHSSRFSQQRTAGLFNDRYSQFKRNAKQVSHSTTNNFSKTRSDQSGMNKNAIIKNKINKIANKPPMVVGSMINKSIKHFLRFNNDKVTNKRSYQFKSGLEKRVSFDIKSRTNVDSQADLVNSRINPKFANRVNNCADRHNNSRMNEKAADEATNHLAYHIQSENIILSKSNRCRPQVLTKEMLDKDLDEYMLKSKLF